MKRSTQMAQLENLFAKRDILVAAIKSVTTIMDVAKDSGLPFGHLESYLKQLEQTRKGIAKKITRIASR